MDAYTRACYPATHFLCLIILNNRRATGLHAGVGARKELELDVGDGHEKRSSGCSFVKAIHERWCSCMAASPDNRRPAQSFVPRDILAIGLGGWYAHWRIEDDPPAFR